MYSVVSNFNSNTWLQVAITIDKQNSNITFFQDGAKIASNNNTTIEMSGSNVNSMVIGNSPISDTYFKGYIDEVMIYNTSLDETAIQTIYDNNQMPQISSGWNHLGASYHKGTCNLTIYHNGTEMGSWKEFMPTLVDNTKPIYVGSNYDGLIGGVQIFERNLTTAEFLELGSNTPVLDYEYVGEYKFENQGIDTSGKNNNMTLSNATGYLNTHAGYIRGSRGLLFTETNVLGGIISGTNYDNYNLDQSVLSVWVRTSNYPYEQVLLNKDGSFEWGINALGQQYIDIISLDKYTSCNAITNDTFTHIATVIDKYGSNVQFMINGSYTDTYSNINISVPVNTNDVTIGYKSGGSSYLGRMDDLRIQLGFDTNVSTIGDSNYSSGTYDTTKLIASYTFDESGGTTATDDSTYKNNGTLSNNPTRYTPSYEAESKCLVLDAASNQYVHVIGNQYSNIDLNLMTLSAWVKASTGSAKTVLLKNDLFDWGIDTNNNIEFNTLSPVNNYKSSLAEASNNIWTHLTLTVDQFNEEVKFYHDGVYQDTVAIDFNFDKTTSDIYIGSNFTGELDNVMIHQGILSDSDIATLATINNPVYTTCNITADTWTHIAATFNKTNNQVCVYQDGLHTGCYKNYLVDFTTIGSNNNDIFIATTGNNIEFLDAIVDDIRVYNRFMTHSNVLELKDLYYERVM